VDLKGIDVRASRVRSIVVEGGTAKGVVLEEGEQLAAPLILSALDPARTLLQLVDPGWLDPELARSVRNIRSRGVAAIVSAQLDRDPGFKALMVAPSPDYVEKAYDCSKYGRVSDSPVIEAIARESGGVWHLEARVQYVPYTALRAAAERRSLGEATLAALGLRCDQVEVLAPSDLENAHGWPQGQPHHAELALDQAFYMRPTPELARYRTPIGGLWLCGPAMHPGVPGMSGFNAARKALGPG
jgi:phytoene dehydrogenase-like protein